MELLPTKLFSTREKYDSESSITIKRKESPAYSEVKLISNYFKADSDLPEQYYL